MNILIASAVYPPEPVVSARLSADLREYLSAQGHEVTVICPQSSRGVEGDAGSGGRSPHNEQTVVRVNSFVCKESQLLGRARESWSFGRAVANWLTENGKRFDGIYANPWPLFAPRHIARAATRARIPFVLHVQDVYPESLVTKLPNWLYRLVAPPLLGLDRRLVQRCVEVVLLSKRIGREYGRTRGVPDRVRVVRNWVDGDKFAQPHDRAVVCREYDVPGDRFTFMYLGNLSAVSAVESVIQAFGKVTRPDRQLVIVGEGSAKAACQKLAQHLRLDNVLFRSEPDAAKVAMVQGMADVFLMPTRKGAARSSTPSKCISYMFSGKPIVAALDPESDAADDIRQADCGWVCEPENLEALAATLDQCVTLPAKVLAAKGHNARAYAEQNFSRQTGVSALAKIILAACRSKSICG